jgi:repressor LexA
MATEKQMAVLDYIRQHQQDTGIPPSVRDIQRQFGFKSPNAAFTHLRALARKGLIEQLAGKTWGLKAIEIQTHLFMLPVYGTIPAGLPAMQEQAPDETIGVDVALFGLRRPREHHVWALRVQGDSMIDAHILDGDLVILERREPQPGDIIAALVDETSTTLKRLIHVRGKPVLRPENKRYRDIVPDHHLESQGVVVGVIRRTST